MSVTSHFDKKADSYDNFRGSGILGKYVELGREAVLRELDINRGETILDVGCGTGNYTCLFKSMGADAFGVDISSKMIESLKKKGVDGAVVDIQDFYLNKKFGKILCAGVLEFVDDAESSVKNIIKFLLADGKLVVLYPTNYFFGYVLSYTTLLMV